MLVPGAANPMLLAANAQYQISRSLRVRASATAYLNRTQTAGSQTTWTWSAWIKRGRLTTLNYLVQAGGSSGSGVALAVTSDDLQVEVGNGTTQYYARSTAQYRDPSAWYHIVAVCNTTSATATLTGTTSDRLQLWVNGVQVSSFSASSIPTQNFAGSMNQNTVVANIGRWPGATPNYYFDGFITEVNFVDGKALTASSFGEYNPVTGVWQPKRYAGTYGTNGYYLNFSDPSAATAAAIGKDSSGNGNNWTPNNISVTAGVTYDSMIDVPTPYADGGNNRGNYPVINPLKNGGETLSAANMLVTAPGAAWYTALSTMAMQSGVYWESTVAVAASSNYHQNGIASASANIGTYLGFDTNGWGITTNGTGTIYYVQYNNATTTITGATGAVANGDVWMYAYKNNKFYWGKNGTWYPTGSNPATETSPVASGLPNEVFAAASMYGTASSYFNFGQRPFVYTPPAGFVAMNTYNMTAATINNGAKYMAATLYTGNGSTQTISNTVNSVSFQPDLVWAKDRTTVNFHALYDSVRGATKDLQSNTTSAEQTFATGLTSFNSNGFTTGSNSDTNANGDAYVAWQWQAGAGTTSSNTSGTITSTVCSGATQGFSVVTYTNSSSGTGTVGHGLGVAPSMIIIKKRNAVSSWNVYHSAIGNTKYLYLNTTDAEATGANRWTNTSPTSTVFTLGTDWAGSETAVAYCFAAVAGFSAFGSYTGNGSTNGPFVYCGFRPRFILIKQSSAIRGWNIEDTSINSYNAMTTILQPNDSAAQNTNTAWSVDALSNGFKIRTTDTGFNQSSGTYIYAAFAENPFNISLAR